MRETLRIGIISDTHGLLRNEIYAAFEGVDEILHAGDVGDPAILTELGVIGPVHAVWGNVDGWEVCSRVPETLEVERLGHDIAVIHGHQWGSPRPEQLIQRYPDHSVIVYGHTHEPLITERDGVLLVNPGSAGRRRFNLPVTVARLQLRRDRRPEAKLIDLRA